MTDGRKLVKKRSITVELAKQIQAYHVQRRLEHDTRYQEAQTAKDKAAAERRIERQVRAEVLQRYVVIGVKL